MSRISSNDTEIDLTAVVIDGDYVLELLRRMVAIDSVLPNEQQLAEFIAAEIRLLGIEPDWYEPAPGRPNVCAAAELGSVDRFLVFSGHSDTVAAVAGWRTDPFELTESDGRLYGLGVYNMKAGIACMLAAFKALLQSDALHPSLGRLGLAVTSDQEGHSIGARSLLETEYGRCDAMLHAEHFYGDSVEDYLPIAVTGKVLYRLTVRGRAAHGNRPHLGINAVADAARIVAALDQLTLRDHPLLGRGTVCALKIDGGYRQYSIVVPEHCEIVVSRLTVPGETRDVAVADMRQLVNSLKLESEVEIETPPPAYDPYFLAEETPLLPVFRRVYEDVTGTAPHFAAHTGIVDANVFAGEARIPTIVFGPKGANHHCAGEYVVRATLEPVARVYAETACRYFTAERS